MGGGEAELIARECLLEHTCLVNVARGKMVNEPTLIEALERKRIAGAALDWDEPLPTALWGAPTRLITPLTAGEAPPYQCNVIAVLLETSSALGAAKPW